MHIRKHNYWIWNCFIVECLDYLLYYLIPAEAPAIKRDKKGLPIYSESNGLLQTTHTKKWVLFLVILFKSLKTSAMIHMIGISQAVISDFLIIALKIYTYLPPNLSFIHCLKVWIAYSSKGSNYIMFAKSVYSSITCSML